MSPQRGPFLNRRLARSFVLLEVLVSLAILGVALSTVMRSFTVSLKAARLSRNVTTATILARGLIDAWEITPPDSGTSTGTFAPMFPEFTYSVDYRIEDLHYKDVSNLENVSRMLGLRRISIDIYYAPHQEANDAKKLVVLRVETALTDSEKYTAASRIQNKIGFD